MPNSTRTKTRRVNKWYVFKYEYNGKVKSTSVLAPTKVLATRYFRNGGKPEYRLATIKSIKREEVKQY